MRIRKIETGRTTICPDHAVRVKLTILHTIRRLELNLQVITIRNTIAEQKDGLTLIVIGIPIDNGLCLPDAKSGQFYGPGSGMMAPKGKAVPFDLESFYDNPETRELLWAKSEEAIGESFDI